MTDHPVLRVPHRRSVEEEAHELLLGPGGHDPASAEGLQRELLAFARLRNRVPWCGAHFLAEFHVDARPPGRSGVRIARFEAGADAPLRTVEVAPGEFRESGGYVAFDFDPVADPAGKCLRCTLARGAADWLAGTVLVALALAHGSRVARGTHLA